MPFCRLLGKNLLNFILVALPSFLWRSYTIFHVSTYCAGLFFVFFYGPFPYLSWFWLIQGLVTLLFPRTSSSFFHWHVLMSPWSLIGHPVRPGCLSLYDAIIFKSPFVVFLFCTVQLHIYFRLKYRTVCFFSSFFYT